MSRSDDEGLAEVTDRVGDALKAGDTALASNLIDEWEMTITQPYSEAQLQFLQFYRRHTGEYDKAIVAACALLASCADEATQMCQQLTLSELYLLAKRHTNCACCLQKVLEWKQLPDYFDVGMVRSLAKNLFDLAADKDAGLSIRDAAFSQAIELVEQGCSTAPIVFIAGREAATSLPNSAERERRLNALELFEKILSRDLAAIREFSSRWDVNFSDGLGRTPLMLAASEGLIDVARALILADALVNSPGSRGLTALHEAASNGHGTVVTFLLQQGAEVNATTQDGVTPLMCAAAWGHLDAVRKLVKAGADLSLTDVKGANAYDIACEKGEDAVSRHLAQQPR